jgi:hypothetical protein
LSFCFRRRWFASEETFDHILSFFFVSLLPEWFSVGVRGPPLTVPTLPNSAELSLSSDGQVVNGKLEIDGTPSMDVDVSPSAFSLLVINLLLFIILSVG